MTKRTRAPRLDRLRQVDEQRWSDFAEVLDRLRSAARSSGADEAEVESVWSRIERRLDSRTGTAKGDDEAG